MSILLLFGLQGTYLTSAGNKPVSPESVFTALWFAQDDKQPYLPTNKQLMITVTLAWINLS